MGILYVCAIILGIAGILDCTKLIRKKPVINILGSIPLSRISLTILSIALLTVVSYDALSIWIKAVPDGVYCYSATVSHKNNTYTLPAQVEKITQSFTDSDVTYFTGEQNDKEVYRDAYIVQRIYWPNGGYLYFDDNDVGQTIGESYSLTDQNGESWDVTITNQRASHPNIKEHNAGKNILNLVEWVVLFLGGIFEVSVFIFKKV